MQLRSGSLGAPSEPALAGSVIDGSLIGATRDTLVSAFVGLAIGAAIGLLAGLALGIVVPLDRARGDDHRGDPADPLGGAAVLAPFVYRLGRHPFTVERAVRFR